MKDINKFQRVLLEISRKSIENFDFEDILGTLMTIHLEPKECYNKMMLSVGGYDNDPRELFMIEEVRDYISFLDKSFPYWFYYVDLTIPKSHSTLMVVLSCVCEVEEVFDKEKEIKRIQLNQDTLNEQIKIHFHFMNEIMDNEGYTEEEIKKRSMDIFQLIY